MIVIALGSNSGDSRRILEDAVQRIWQHAGRPICLSTFHETEPVECPAGSPPFLNAVLVFPERAGESPESWMVVLQRVEAEFGRVRGGERNAPRTLDLDLIMYGSERRNSAELVVPHPRAHTRAFVLGPLAELAPDCVLPGQRLSVAELLRGLAPSPCGAQPPVSSGPI